MISRAAGPIPKELVKLSHLKFVYICLSSARPTKDDISNCSEGACHRVQFKNGLYHESA
jgi:hypothetical protein